MYQVRHECPESARRGLAADLRVTFTLEIGTKSNEHSVLFYSAGFEHKHKANDILITVAEKADNIFYNASETADNLMGSLEQQSTFYAVKL